MFRIVITKVMPNLYLRNCFIILSLLFGACQNRAADFKVTNLVCDQSFDVGYQTVRSFSWKISGAGNWYQGAYQVVVSGAEDHSSIIWDSGKII